MTVLLRKCSFEDDGRSLFTSGAGLHAHFIESAPPIENIIAGIENGSMAEIWVSDMKFPVSSVDDLTRLLVTSINSKFNVMSYSKTCFAATRRKMKCSRFLENPSLSRSTNHSLRISQLKHWSLSRLVQKHRKPSKNVGIGWAMAGNVTDVSRGAPISKTKNALTVQSNVMTLTTSLRLTSAASTAVCTKAASNFRAAPTRLFSP